MADGKMQGFGTQAIGFGQGAAFKKVSGAQNGLPTKDVRPIGGNVQGETGGTPAEKGPAAMDQVGSGEGVGVKGGKGPTDMPKQAQTANQKQVDKGNLGGKNVRPMAQDGSGGGKGQPGGGRRNKNTAPCPDGGPGQGKGGGQGGGKNR